MEVVLINYSEFLDIKNYNYSMERIKYYVCKHLGCKTEDIEDIFFDYKLFIIAFIKQDAIYLYKSNINYSKLKCRYCVFCKKAHTRGTRCWCKFTGNGWDYQALGVDYFANEPHPQCPLRALIKKYKEN